MNDEEMELNDEVRYNTPICQAILNRDNLTVDKLLQSASDEEFNLAFECACVNSQTTAIALIILHKWPDIAVLEHELYSAAINNRAKVVDTLLQSGHAFSNITQVLHKTVEFGFTRVVESII